MDNLRMPNLKALGGRSHPLNRTGMVHSRRWGDGSLAARYCVVR